MMTTTALYPWEVAAVVADEQAEAEALADATHSAWIWSVANDPTDPATMSEADFLHFVVDQLASGEQAATVTLGDADLAAIDEEAIGADFCRQPFLY